MTPRVIVEPARLAGRSLLRCQTDERLVDLARAGNERAFEAIVDRYSRPLQRYCARLLPSARAEDVVQQAFLNAYAGLRRDERRIELRPWLYRIAHNAALNGLRESGWSHDRLETALAGTDTTHEAFERRASLETVIHAVQMLPERQRNAMILRELEGRSYEQIAIELDATGGAVRQLLYRARLTLRAAATAVTPVGVVSRLPLGSGAVAERVSDAAAHESLRVGAGRIAGGVAASLAVAAGLSEAPRHVHLPRVHASRDGAATARGWPTAPGLLAPGPRSAHRPAAKAPSSGRLRAQRLPAGALVVGGPARGVSLAPRAGVPLSPLPAGELSPLPVSATPEPPVTPEPAAPPDPVPDAAAVPAPGVAAEGAAPASPVTPDAATPDVSAAVPEDSPAEPPPAEPGEAAPAPAPTRAEPATEENRPEAGPDDRGGPGYSPARASGS